jgi:quercetin dioxygenase-like cupin family protein
MGKVAIKNPGRRRFLCAVPAAAVAGLTLTDASLFSAFAVAQSATPAPPLALQKFAAQEIQDDMQALAANPGNKNLVTAKNLTVVLTSEKTKSGKEFEWHEGRDHIFQILEGSTVYELGGTPKNQHSTGPGEWLAPESDGAVKMTLSKGDMLVVPRGTPHKRTTADSVTFYLISPMGTVA